MEVNRPPQTLLNKFYTVVSCNKQTRLSSIKVFLECSDIINHKEYVIERLIAGLSSARTASRHGYSVVLTLLLTQSADEFSIEKLFEMADKNYNSKTLDLSNGAIGYHILCTSCYLSGQYLKDASQLIEKHLEIANNHLFLRASITDSIIMFCEELKKIQNGLEIFKKDVLPHIKSQITKKLNEMSAEEFFLLAGLRSSFSNILKNENSLITDKRIILSESDFPVLIELLKKADPSLKCRLILLILELGKENDAFTVYFKKIFVEYAWHGDLGKAAERYFRLFIQLVSSTQLKLEELLLTFDEEFIKNIRKYSHRIDPIFRGLHLLILNLFEKIEERLNSEDEKINQKNIQEKLLLFVEKLDEVEGGDFDTKVGTKVKLSEFIIGKLSGDYLIKFIDKAVINFQPWSMRRLEVSYKKQNLEVSKKILKILIENAKKSEEAFNTLCSFLNNMFVIKFRRGECLGSQLSTQNDAVILHQVAAELLGTKKEKKKDSKIECLEILGSTLSILGASSSSVDVRSQYFNDAREARRLARKFKSNSVVVELLLSILIYKNRVHKFLVYYVFSQLCLSKHISIAEAKFITIYKKDGQLTGDIDCNEDDEFEKITEEELKELKNKENIDNNDMEVDENCNINEEDDSNKEDDESEEEDDESDNDEEVNPKLVQDVKKALGNAILDNDDEDNYKNMDNMDEAEIEKLDKALADAFVKNSRKERNLKKDELKFFRGKCIDLIIIFVSLTKFSSSEEAILFSNELTVLSGKLKDVDINEFKVRVDNILKLVLKVANKLNKKN